MYKKSLAAIILFALCFVLLLISCTSTGGPYRAIVSSMADEEIEEVINILETDQEIKGLLDRGAVISSMSNHMLSMEAVRIGEGPGELLEKRVSVGIDSGNKHYYVDVDVIREQILWFGDTPRP